MDGARLVYMEAEANRLELEKRIQQLDGALRVLARLNRTLYGE